MSDTMFNTSESQHTRKYADELIKLALMREGKVNREYLLVWYASEFHQMSETIKQVYDHVKNGDDTALSLITRSLSEAYYRRKGLERQCKQNLYCPKESGYANFYMEKKHDGKLELTYLDIIDGLFKKITIGRRRSDAEKIVKAVKIITFYLWFNEELEVHPIFHELAKRYYEITKKPAWFLSLLSLKMPTSKFHNYWVLINNKDIIITDERPVKAPSIYMNIIEQLVTEVNRRARSQNFDLYEVYTPLFNDVLNNDPMIAKIYRYFGINESNFVEVFNKTYLYSFHPYDLRRTPITQLDEEAEDIYYILNNHVYPLSITYVDLLPMLKSNKFSDSLIPLSIDSFHTEDKQIVIKCKTDSGYLPYIILILKPVTKSYGKDINKKYLEAVEHLLTNGEAYLLINPTIDASVIVLSGKISIEGDDTDLTMLIPISRNDDILKLYILHLKKIYDIKGESHRIFD